jgi:hypothetical protein
METTTVQKPTALSAAALLIRLNMLLSGYRKLEVAPLETGFEVIKRTAKSYQVNHLCGHWRSKKKDFGAYYLNLDYKCQFSLLNSFGIYDDIDKAFIAEFEADERKMLFVRPKGILKAAHAVLIFFNNHGISTNPAGDGSVNLNVLPAKNKQYGNSANWGAYMLALPSDERNRILAEILHRDSLKND